MSTRAVVWALVALAVVLVLLPLVGMLSMGGRMMGGGMIGMHVGGILWLVLTIIVMAALVALLVRGETKA